MNTQLPITYRDYKIRATEHGKLEFVHVEYDGPEDKRIGTGDTLLDCMLAIDDQVIDSQEKIINTMIDQDIKVKLQGSIQIENLKQDLAKLNNMLTNREATIEVLTGFIENAIKTFEYKFESDEGCFNYEQMQAYVDMNAYMLAKAGKTSSPKLRQVLGRMNEMAA